MKALKKTKGLVQYCMKVFTREIQDCQPKIRASVEHQGARGIKTLHNMAPIAYRKNDIEKYLELETTAYRIALKINDAMGIYSVGRDLGDQLIKTGNKKEGLEMMQRSIAIGRAAGFPDVGQLEALVREISAGKT